MVVGCESHCRVDPQPRLLHSRDLALDQWMPTMLEVETVESIAIDIVRRPQSPDVPVLRFEVDRPSHVPCDVAPQRAS